MESVSLLAISDVDRPEAIDLALTGRQLRLRLAADGLGWRLPHVERENENAHDLVAVSERQMLGAHAPQMSARVVDCLQKVGHCSHRAVRIICDTERPARAHRATCYDISR